MTRRHNRVGSLSVSEYRSLNPNVEKLEDRMAPGCVLDCFGVTALGLYSGLDSPTQSRAAAQDTDTSASVPRARVKTLLRDGPTSPTEITGAQRTLKQQDGLRNDANLLANNSPGIDDKWASTWTGIADGVSGLESVFSSLGLLPGFGLTSEEFGAGEGNGLGLASKNPRSGSMFSGPVPSSKLVNSFSVGGVSSAALSTGLAHTTAATFDSSAITDLPPGAGAGSDEGAQESRLPRGLPYPRGTDPDQPLHPYALTHQAQHKTPTTGVVRSPAEYDPMRGVIFSYASFGSTVTDMVKELTEDPTKDEIAYVVVSGPPQQNAATTSFMNAGVDMSKVQFFAYQTDSVWIRDYGPHFITVDDALAIVDSHYYPNRSLDNFIPTLLGDNNFKVPTYDMGLYYSGGNFQPGPNNSGFVTSLVNYHNTTTDGFDADFIAELYNKYQGIETLHVMPQLPFSVDGTGHIDMWLYLVDEDTVILSEFKPGSNATAIEITNNAVAYMENLGFEVFRPQAWNVGSTHYTYTNAFRVNDRIFVPVYGTAIKPGGNSNYNDEDADAMAIWQAAAGPDVELIPIQSFEMIPSAGAIHCIVMQVPRYTGSAPAVNVITPADGGLVLKGSQQKIEWSAIDTNNVDPSEIGIYLSRNGGQTYSHIATTTDTGSYLWNVSGRGTNNAIIKIVATSADNDQFEAFSDPFRISAGTASTYDFSSGAGVNKFAYGWQTAGWANIDGNLSPVGTQLSSGNYVGMSTSNAMGGDTDSNRYIAPVPNPTSNESTHTFAFTLNEAVRRIAQIDVNWEGYADFCTQVELYVWDLVAGNWGDATGLTDNNRYMDSWAGNADGNLNGSIRSDFSRYVDESGMIRFLVYADRTGTSPDTQHNVGQGLETFHDYMSVTVKQGQFIS